MKFEEINFDLDDKNLFLVDDLQLKADAIRHSILPKLEIITNTTTAIINEVYQTNVFDLSTILKFPNFRKTRTKELIVNYTTSEAGLGAKRNAKIWKSILRKNGERPMILPFSQTFCLDEKGLHFYFSTVRYGLKLKSYKPFYEFHINNNQPIENITNEANIKLLKQLDEYKQFLFLPKSNYFDFNNENDKWDIMYFSKKMTYPISNENIKSLVDDFVIFYPIYESYLRIASNEKIILDSQIVKLKKWLIQQIDLEFSNFEETENEKSDLPTTELLRIADTKIKVMPAIRWQVFQRDNWKCVACGRSSENGVILHIDHIIPRSKGGQDHLDNYQTLCETCNIGKSNRDQTDLRAKLKTPVGNKHICKSTANGSY